MAEIRASAKIFLDRFGLDSPFQAQIRSDELLAAGDFQGRARWQLIRQEVESLIKSQLVN